MLCCSLVTMAALRHFELIGCPDVKKGLLSQSQQQVPPRYYVLPLFLLLSVSPPVPPPPPRLLHLQAHLLDAISQSQRMQHPTLSGYRAVWQPLMTTIISQCCAS